MKDRDFLRCVLLAMQSSLEDHELVLSHLKLVHQRLEALDSLANNLLGLLKLPQTVERDDLIDELRALIESQTVQDSTRRLIAKNESHHELRAAQLADLKNQIETLE